METTKPPETTSDVDALHRLADEYDRAALMHARMGLSMRKAPHDEIVATADPSEEAALRRFQLADHLRKLATRQQVGAVTTPGQPDAERAIAHLLAAKVENRTVAALLRDAAAKIGFADCTLSAHGIRYLADTHKVAIAQQHHELAKIYTGTAWDGFGYTRALQSNVNVSASRVRIGGAAHSCTILPAELFGLQAAQENAR